MIIDDYLAAAWTHCAPNRDKSLPFPRGFWPDIARVALEMQYQMTIYPELDFRPTMCERGSIPGVIIRNKSGLDLSKLEITL